MGIKLKMLFNHMKSIFIYPMHASAQSKRKYSESEKYEMKSKAQKIIDEHRCFKKSISWIILKPLADIAQFAF